MGVQRMAGTRGRMPFLSPNHQRQSTEGDSLCIPFNLDNRDTIFVARQPIQGGKVFHGVRVTVHLAAPAASSCSDVVESLCCNESSPLLVFEFVGHYY